MNMALMNTKMMKKNREKLLSVTIHDCEVQTYRGSGKGGQNRNKRDTAVRIIHHPSNAVGQAQDERSQWQNKKLAFKRMAESKEFQTWVKIEAAKQMGLIENIKKKVEKEMRNIKIEVKDKNGRWIEEQGEEDGSI